MGPDLCSSRPANTSRQICAHTHTHTHTHTHRIWKYICQHMSVCVYPAVSGLWNLDEISRCVLAWTGLLQVVSLTCKAAHTVKGKWVLTLVEHTSYACSLNPERGTGQTFTPGVYKPARFFCFLNILLIPRGLFPFVCLCLHWSSVSSLQVDAKTLNKQLEPPTKFESTAIAWRCELLFSRPWASGIILHIPHTRMH